MIRKQSSCILLPILMLLCTYNNAHFATLTELKKYTASMPEYPDSDSNNWLRPDYSSFHRAQMPTRWQRFKNWLGFKSQPYWSASQFKKLLKKVTSQRENNGYSGRFVEKKDPDTYKKIIIVGDLHGSLHSWVRDLESLHKRKIIDENLTIINKEYLLVFNGNVIDLSPYVLETLTVVLQLMLKNPQQVVYLRGRHEDKEHWHNFCLRKELEVRATSVSPQTIPLNKEIKRFFNTLPLALYLVSPGAETQEAVRISYFGREYPELNEEQFGDFFAQKTNGQHHIFNLKNKRKASEKVEIKAIIKAEDRRTSFTPTKGLRYTDADKGATSWVLLSSPNRTHRTLYRFFYDSYVIVHTHGAIENWTISIYNQDVRDMLGIHKTKTYNLFSTEEITSDTNVSQKSANTIKQLQQQLKKAQEQFTNLKQQKETQQQCVTPPDTTKPITETTKKRKKPLIVATSMDLTTGLKAESEQTLLGMKLRLDAQNKQGGVGNKKIILRVADDKYDPQKARANIKNFMKQTDIILSPMSSTTVAGFLDLIKEHKILTLFPSTGSPALRGPAPEWKSMIHWRASYSDIDATLIDYAQKELKAQKLAFFYQDDVSAAGIPENIKAAGIKEHVMTPYKKNATTLKKQAETLISFDPDTIIMLGISRAAMILIKEIKQQAGAQYLTKKHLIGTELGSTEFRTFLQEENLLSRYIDSQNLPNPATSTLPIVQEYRKALQKSGKSIPDDVDIFSLEGYVAADLFIYLLEQLNKKNKPFTKKQIIAAAEQIKNITHKGLKLNFDPQTRQLTRSIWLAIGDQSEWKHIELKAGKKPRSTKKKVTKKSAPAPEKKEKKPEKKTDAPKKDTKKPAKKQTAQKTGTLVIGSTMDFTKSLKVESEETRRGLTLRFNQENKKGGINGTKLRLVILDDQYDPTKARKNIKKLQKEHKTDIILSPMSSLTILGKPARPDAPEVPGYYQEIKDGNILVFAPSTGSSALRDENLKNILHFRPDYSGIDITIFKYAMEQHNAKKFVIFYDETEPELMNDVKAAGITQFQAVTYQTNVTNLSKQAKLIKEFKPDTIALFSNSRIATELIRQLTPAWFVMGKKKIMLGTEMGDKKFRDFLNEVGLRQQFIDTQNLPNPQTSNLQIVKEYRQAMGKKPLGIFSLEAYIVADIFIYILHKIAQKNLPLTKENIIAETKKIKDYNHKGIMLNFDPKKRQLSKNIWLDTGGTEWVEYEIKHQ